mmetsp:Transcript_53755/g.142460  ORF Transcript_53755/g.142460 Transcript_53755/m.142460 type:complete len:267 (-) Transcript_53755:104-904(-)
MAGGSEGACWIHLPGGGLAHLDGRRRARDQQRDDHGHRIHDGPRHDSPGPLQLDRGSGLQHRRDRLLHVLLRRPDRVLPQGALGELHRGRRHHQDEPVLQALLHPLHSRQLPVLHLGGPGTARPRPRGTHGGHLLPRHDVHHGGLRARHLQHGLRHHGPVVRRRLFHLPRLARQELCGPHRQHAGRRRGHRGHHGVPLQLDAPLRPHHQAAHGPPAHADAARRRHDEKLHRVGLVSCMSALSSDLTSERRGTHRHDDRLVMGCSPT